jgi:zinc/manganese transport system permease protein
VLRAVFEPGFFDSGPVRVAIVAGGVVAVVSAVVGVFTVVRGQSFAGHAIADVGTTGGSGAFLLGIGPIWGFVAAGLVAASVMELFGVRRPRGRDLATGIVLGGALGIAALLLYFDATVKNTTGATMTILFGSMFTISSSIVPVFVLLSAAALGLVAVLYRPLMLCSLDTDLAAARGVPVRTVGALYLAAMAVAVSLSCVTIGAILSTALLVGPAATALRVARRPGVAIAVAALLGLCVTWLGVLLAYDSFYWPPVGHGWPVSFFVVSLVFCSYVLAGVPAGRARSRRVL